MPITVWIKQQIQSKYFKAGNQHQNFKACFWHVFLQKYIGSPSTNHRGSNDDVIKMAAIIQSYKLLCISGTIYPIVLISTPNHTISTSIYHLEQPFPPKLPQSCFICTNPRWRTFNLTSCISQELFIQLFSFQHQTTLYRRQFITW